MRKPPATDKPRAAVVGPGAVGGLLAAYMARAGLRPLLIGRTGRFAATMRRKGLSVSGGPFGAALRLREGLVELRPAPCDIVFFCVKSGDARAAIRRARPLIRPDTVVVSLQNGLTHLRTFRSAFGRRRTVFGVSFMASNRPGSWRVRHSAGKELCLAKRSDNGEAADAAVRILRKAGLNAATTPFEERLLWTKAAVNAAANPLGALTGRTNGELATIAPLRELLLRALKEAVRAADHPPLYRNLKRLVISGAKKAPDQPNSMLQDLRAGRRTEIEAIVKPFLDSARRKKIRTPILNSFYRFVRRLERELTNDP